MKKLLLIAVMLIAFVATEAKTKYCVIEIRYRYDGWVADVDYGEGMKLLTDNEGKDVVSEKSYTYLLNYMSNLGWEVLTPINSSRSKDCYLLKREE